MKNRWWTFRRKAGGPPGPLHDPVPQATLFHAENSAAATPQQSRALTPLAAILMQHILRDGELIILAMRPSLWYVPLVCVRFITAVLIVVIGVHVFANQLSHRSATTIVEAGVLLIVSRLMFGVIQWSSQLYVLTNLRILRLSGIFNPVVFDCPLRKVARARLIRAIRERVLGVGTIEIIPSVEELPAGLWPTVAHPREIHRIISAAITKAKQGSGYGMM